MSHPNNNSGTQHTPDYKTASTRPTSLAKSMFASSATHGDESRSAPPTSGWGSSAAPSTTTRSFRDAEPIGLSVGGAPPTSGFTFSGSGGATGSGFSFGASRAARSAHLDSVPPLAVERRERKVVERRERKVVELSDSDGESSDSDGELSDSDGESSDSDGESSDSDGDAAMVPEAQYQKACAAVKELVAQLEAAKNEKAAMKAAMKAAIDALVQEKQQLVGDLEQMLQELSELRAARRDVVSVEEFHWMEDYYRDVIARMERSLLKSEEYAARIAEEYAVLKRTLGRFGSAIGEWVAPTTNSAAAAPVRREYATTTTTTTTTTTPSSSATASRSDDGLPDDGLHDGDFGFDDGAFESALGELSMPATRGRSPPRRSSRSPTRTRKAKGKDKAKAKSKDKDKAKGKDKDKGKAKASADGAPSYWASWRVPVSEMQAQSRLIKECEVQHRRLQQEEEGRRLQQKLQEEEGRRLQQKLQEEEDRCFAEAEHQREKAEHQREKAEHQREEAERRRRAAAATKTSTNGGLLAFAQPTRSVTPVKATKATKVTKTTAPTKSEDQFFAATAAMFGNGGQ